MTALAAVLCVMSPAHDMHDVPEPIGCGRLSVHSIVSAYIMSKFTVKTTSSNLKELQKFAKWYNSFY